jgi:hypothetical protein
VRKLELAAAEKEWAEAQAIEPLPPETAEVLQAEHDLRIGAALKQAEVSAQLVDAAYEAAQPAHPRQLFVRRGGEMGNVERCRLKPGELIFARTPAGEYEAVGCVDSRGGLPPTRRQIILQNIGASPRPSLLLLLPDTPARSARCPPLFGRDHG